MPKTTSYRFKEHDPPAAGGLRVRSMPNPGWGGDRWYLIQKNAEGFIPNTEEPANGTTNNR